MSKGNRIEAYFPSFTDISQWNVNAYTNTGGTRSKQIAVHPETYKDYFFKGSKVIAETNEIRYPTEFWSEIISSKIGQYFGFNMLDYNIGYNERDFQKIGCLSASMVEHSNNKLTEGKMYLMGLNANYSPNLKEHQVLYTFQFIMKALNKFQFNNFSKNIIEIIIFDSIVGNSDRHQENWGIITNYNESIQRIDKHIIQSQENWFKKQTYHLSKWYLKFISKNLEKLKKIPKTILSQQAHIAPSVFAPIYDSGCCLGREIEENRLNKMLNDKVMLESYVRKGLSEIYWEGMEKRLNHFELIKLVKEIHPEVVKEIIGKVLRKFEGENIKQIIFNADKNLPSYLSNYKLADNRKELMNKIVNLRIEKLREIL